MKEKIDYFCVKHLVDDIKGHSIKSSNITIVAQIIKMSLQVISITSLSRILSPKDFGLVAMVFVVTNLFAMLKDGGLSMATIQRQNITHEQVTNLFWLNVFLGICLMILTVAISPFLAWVYDEPLLTNICIVMSVVFLIGGFSVQHEALLRRQMQFKYVVLIDVVSMAIGIAFGVGSALNDAGFWALVIMQVATVISQVVISWALCAWRPSFPVRGSGVRPLINFGVSLTSANFIGYLFSNFTPFLVGYIGGSGQLGIYNRMYTLASIPSIQILPPLVSVAQPALSRVSDDPDQFNKFGISIIKKTAIVGIYITVFIAVMADWIVMIMLGSSWNDGVDYLRILAMFTLIEPITSVVAMLLIAKGESSLLLKSKIISLIAVIISGGIGSIWGVYGVVFAFAVSGLLIRVPLFIWLACKKLPISQGEIYGKLTPLALMAIFLGILMMTIKSKIYCENLILGLTIVFFTTFFAYIFMLVMGRETKQDVLDMIFAIKAMFARR